MIDVLHFGPAHTTGDSIVHFPNANVIHLGDVGNLEVAPFIDVDNGGSIDGMIYSLEKVLNIIDENTKVVPGHGDIANKSVIKTYLNGLVQVRNKIEAFISEGKTLAEVQEINPAFEYFPVGPELLNDRVFTSLSEN